MVTDGQEKQEAVYGHAHATSAADLRLAANLHYCAVSDGHTAFRLTRHTNNIDREDDDDRYHHRQQCEPHDGPRVTSRSRAVSSASLLRMFRSRVATK